MPASAFPDHTVPPLNRASFSTHPGFPSGADTSGCFPRASPSRRPALKASHPYSGSIKLAQRWRHREPVSPAGGGCSGRGGPRNGLAVRVLSHWPRGAAVRGRRFIFFFSMLIQSILPTLSRNLQLAAHPDQRRGAACARLCTSPARRSPAPGSPGFVSHIYFRLGKVSLWFRNDVRNAGHQEKEQIHGFTRETVIRTHLCQTPAHFKCQHMRRKREKIPGSCVRAQ